VQNMDERIEKLLSIPFFPFVLFGRWMLASKSCPEWVAACGVFSLLLGVVEFLVLAESGILSDNHESFTMMLSSFVDHPYVMAFIMAFILLFSYALCRFVLPNLPPFKLGFFRPVKLGPFLCVFVAVSQFWLGAGIALTYFVADPLLQAQALFVGVLFSAEGLVAALACRHVSQKR